MQLGIVEAPRQGVRVDRAAQRRQRLSVRAGSWRFKRYGVLRAAEGVLTTLRQEETIASVAPNVPSFQEFFNLVGMKDVQELELRYGVPEEGRAGY